MALLANIYRDPKKTRLYVAKDFLLRFEPEKPRVRKTGKELFATFAAITGMEIP